MFRQTCWLIKSGVPFDTAHALADSGPDGRIEALAYSVTFGEMEGGEFSWSEMKWVEKNG